MLQCRSTVRPAWSGAIDVHNHFYPPSYLEELKNGRGAATVTEDADANYILAYEGDYNIIVPGHRDIEFRLEELDRAGIQAQVLSLTTPGAHIESPERGIRLARMTNDDFAAISQRFPGRFYAFAALPLQDPEASVRELERAVKDLGLKGGTLFTNVNGRTLDDPAYEDLFRAARELDTVLYIHPTTPSPSDAFLDYRLVATVGFTVDTTLAVARLIFSGMLDRVPGLKIIASHLGGCLPYLAERLDRGWAAYPECKKASRAPSSYIKETYIDCVSFEPLAVDFARRLMGADRLLVGSDYPHQIGDLRRCTQIIAELDAPEDEKAAILNGNARTLFKLGS